MVEFWRSKKIDLVLVCGFFILGLLAPRSNSMDFMQHLTGFSYGVGIGLLYHLFSALAEWRKAHPQSQ